MDSEKEQEILKKRKEAGEKAITDRLDEITKSEPAALSQADKEFLTARRDYLTKDQVETFADVIKEGLARMAGTGEAAEEKPAKKK